MKVSVIIPTYNRGDVLCRVIEMLLEQDFDGDYEVIVIDQTPSYPPEVKQRLDSLMDRIRYYRLDYPNVAAARNLGVKLAKAEIINFTDDDTIIPKDYIISHYRNFVNPDRRMAGVMGLLLNDMYSGKQNCLEMMKSRFGAQGEVKLGDVVSVKWLTGGNTSYRRRVLFEVGMFDEYLSAYGEDLDISMRIRRLGYQFFLDTRIVIFHLSLPYGGIHNNYENLQQQKLASFSYCILKNRDMEGIWPTLRTLFREYRYYALCRSVIRKGLREWIRRNLTYIRLMKDVISHLRKNRFKAILD